MAVSLPRAYFVAPTAARDELRRDGIVPDAEIDGGVIWLYDGPELASRRAEVLREHYVDTPAGNADVWRVDLSGIRATLHRAVHEGQNVTVDVDTIAADRLTLTETL